MKRLTKEQKKSLFLLQFGTFLEYFDLMLFINISPLLNSLFLPSISLHQISSISALSFCVSYFFKPLGALFFGYIGDKIGRKNAVIISTIMMACVCIIIANLPTYAQIGITASYIIIICKGIQAMSCVGESIGAELYAAELVDFPSKHQAVGYIGLSGVIGMATSMLIVQIIMLYNINWRLVFWGGAIIAFISSKARITLRESVNFSDAKRRLFNMFKTVKKSTTLLKNNPVFNEKVPHKTSLAYFLVFTGWPFSFYFSYIYCSDFLRIELNYSHHDITNNNLIVSLFNVSFLFLFIKLTKKIHPLIILKAKLLVYIPLLIITPWLLTHYKTAFIITIIKIMHTAFGCSTIPAKAIFLTHFPIFKRFKYGSFISSLSHMFTYLIITSGLSYIYHKSFNHYLILAISLPITIMFVLGLLYFEKLEKQSSRYHFK